MNTDAVYFDNNATTPPDPRVLDEMYAAFRAAFANPGSQHSFGRVARRVLEDSREQIAEILDADPSELIFTSGGTESLNTAIHGFTFGRRGYIGLTAGEHPATREACQQAASAGMRMVHLPVTSTGLLDTAALPQLPWSENEVVRGDSAAATRPASSRTSHCFQNSAAVTGFRCCWMPCRRWARLISRFARVVRRRWHLELISFTGRGGIGGLILRRGVRIPGLLVGGHQESGRRAGTEPVPLAAGMAAALKYWHAERRERYERMSAIRDQLAAGLQKLCGPIVIHGSAAARLPNTLNVAFPGISGEALLVNLHLSNT
ncbi:MAG UNVERIFIED_CONTAM: aminotransferase class V-fold PLP-dependent enzyme [Planctomycetaceae bacterium]|jgi:cysteine desulfurase